MCYCVRCKYCRDLSKNNIIMEKKINRKSHQERNLNIKGVRQTRKLYKKYKKKSKKI